VIKFIVGLFSKKELADSNPKYRLVPDRYGTYTLERYDSSLGVYLAEMLETNKDNADKAIANMERDIKYYICDDIGDTVNKRI